MKPAPWLVIAVIVVTGAVLVPRVSTALAANAANHQQDFGIFYRSAGCLLGGGCRAYDASADVAPNLAPPHALLAIAPFGALDQRRGYFLFLLCSVVVLAIQAVRIARALDLRLAPLVWLAIATVV